MASDKDSAMRMRVRKRRRSRNRLSSAGRRSGQNGQSVSQLEREPSKHRKADEHEQQVDWLVGVLQKVMSSVVVCVAALRNRNSDLDEDIAAVLVHSAADPLDVEIEKLNPSAFHADDKG